MIKKVSYYLILIAVLGSSFIFVWLYQKYFKEEKPTQLFFKVEKGKLTEIVKTRGEVAPAKELDLSFPFSGIVEKIFVKEGQLVDQNDLLMKLDTTDFEIKKTELENLLIQNKANFNKLLAGPTKEEIKVLETKVLNAQKSLEDAQINLDNVKEKAEIDLANQYKGISDILNDAYVKADDALRKQIDELFDNDDSDSPLLTFAVFNNQVKVDIEAERFSTGYELKKFKNKLDNLSSEKLFLDETINDVETTLFAIRIFLNHLNETVNGAVGVSSSALSAHKSGVNTARTNINIAISNIGAKKQSIASQKIINQNSIFSAQSSLNEAKNFLSLAEEELNLKKSGARAEDIEIAGAQVRVIQNQIAEIKEKIRKSVILAPISGKIAKIWLETREIFNVGQIAVSLVSLSYKIQSEISELEIGKIKENAFQKADVFQETGGEVLIQFDAFPKKEFKGFLTSIEPKEIIKEGDKYYRVNIHFKEEVKEPIRSGMSADLKIIISSKENVLIVPELAVYEKDDKKFVKVLEKEMSKETEIEIGISDEESVEIVKGLEEGQIIIVSD